MKYLLENGVLDTEKAKVLTTYTKYGYGGCRIGECKLLKTEKGNFFEENIITKQIKQKTESEIKSILISLNCVGIYEEIFGSMEEL